MPHISEVVVVVESMIQYFTIRPGCPQLSAPQCIMFVKTSVEVLGAAGLLRITHYTDMFDIEPLKT
jgi:hypothetical protein